MLTETEVPLRARGGNHFSQHLQAPLGSRRKRRPAASGTGAAARRRGDMRGQVRGAGCRRTGSAVRRA
ncbi:hypothetical protein [Streptomyces sp. e14]|uniref:hypothetical protein n=1 Tax=Streptomyces sp. e14 TaxID=645465 RepID=UPI0005B80F10